MTDKNTYDALQEIRELTLDAPDAVVALELIGQVLDRLHVPSADGALQRLAREGALDAIDD